MRTAPRPFGAGTPGFSIDTRVPRCHSAIRLWSVTASKTFCGGAEKCWSISTSIIAADSHRRQERVKPRSSPSRDLLDGFDLRRELVLSADDDHARSGETSPQSRPQASVTCGGDAQSVR